CRVTGAACDAAVNRSPYNRSVFFCRPDIRSSAIAPDWFPVVTQLLHKQFFLLPFVGGHR
ncbi:hypothetical protein, partial [Salmonella enterica]|uniref:hypothetical protein n=1 Tax=Salmonella enterica TaxID=28901 RepID=UPI0024928273